MNIYNVILYYMYISIQYNNMIPFAVSNSEEEYYMKMAPPIYMIYLNTKPLINSTQYS